MSKQKEKINVIMIETVGICNGKCEYCPQGRGLVSIGDGPNFISEKVLEKALNLAKQGDSKAIYLHHRGEPLLHPKIGYVIRRVRDSGFYAYLSTNLIAATPQKLKDILIAGINQIEIHYSGGFTILSDEELWSRIHTLYKLNWSIRNSGCRIEINYALKPNETAEEVRHRMSKAAYYDETVYIRFYRPHDWPSLYKLEDKGIKPEWCKWYKTKSCAILCNGDVVICCLDQFRYSKKINILEIDELKWEYLTKRDICKGCIQYNWDMDWLEEDALNVPDWLERKLKIDTWR